MDDTDANAEERGPEGSRPGSEDSDQPGLAQLRASLLKHLSDGRFTDQELQVARAQRQSLGLSAQSVRALRADVFHSAYMDAYQDGVISPAEADTLDRLMRFFNEPDVNGPDV